jgi:hypothetical protein
MNKLTEISIRKAEILQKQYKIYDGDGMFLLIHPNGSKYWRMKYTFDGKSKLASFGVWPGISLKKARERRHDAKQKIKMGLDPVMEKRNNKKHQRNQAKIKSGNEYVNDNESSCTSFEWSALLSPHVKMRKKGALLKLLKSLIFGIDFDKSLSLLDEKERNLILSRIYRNRSELLHIIWEFYIIYPILNFAVLFLLLFIAMGFFPAIMTTILYFFFKVFAAVSLTVWEVKKEEG